MATLTILIIIVGLFAWTLRPKKTNKPKIGDKFKPKQDLLLPIAAEHRSTIVTPLMILEITGIDDYCYYMSVSSNHLKVWSERNLQCAKNGDIVEVGKDLINKFKMK